MLVTLHLTVPALVALFAQSSRQRSFADFAYRSPWHVFRYERVIVEYVKLGALFPPLALLCKRQRYQIMLSDTVLKGLENQRGGFIHVRPR